MARMKRATDEEVLGDGESKIRVIRDIRGQSAFGPVDAATKLRWVVCLFLQIGFGRFRLYKPNEDWGMNHGWHRWHG